jgi:hypothetical protein
MTGKGRAMDVKPKHGVSVTSTSTLGWLDMEAIKARDIASRSLANLRETLLSKLLSGELPVKTNEEVAA